AEDGTRDFHVTGVQTCALPICIHVDMDDLARAAYRLFPQLRIGIRRRHVASIAISCFVRKEPQEIRHGRPVRLPDPQTLAAAAYIGRASCRERVWRDAAAGGI